MFNEVARFTPTRFTPSCRRNKSMDTISSWWKDDFPVETGIIDLRSGRSALVPFLLAGTRWRVLTAPCRHNVFLFIELQHAAR